MTLDDIIARGRKLLPHGWFADVDEVRDALLAGAASVFLHVKALLATVQAQTRVSTATGGHLDLIAYDFFGSRIRRFPGQSDEALRFTIKREVLRERVTRRGIVKAVEDLTGRPVVSWELWNPTDCGGFDTGYCGFDEVIGRMGSIEHPRQMFLQVVQPIGAGIPDVGGMDFGLGGVDLAPGILADLALVQGAITHQDIYDTINLTRAAGITVWVAIGDPPLRVGRLGIDFILDERHLA
jgi:hypothetical protein